MTHPARPKPFINDALLRTEPLVMTTTTYSEANVIIGWLKDNVGTCNVDWGVSSVEQDTCSQLYIHDKNKRLLFALAWSHILT